MKAAELIQVLGLLASGGVLTALIAVIASRRKTGAETTDVITQAAERAVQVISEDNTRLRLLVEGLQSHVERLEQRVTAQDKRISELETENAVLLRQLAAWDPNKAGCGTAK